MKRGEQAGRSESILGLVIVGKGERERLRAKCAFRPCVSEFSGEHDYLYVHLNDHPSTLTLGLGVRVTPQFPFWEMLIPFSWHLMKSIPGR